MLRASRSTLAPFTRTRAMSTTPSRSYASSTALSITDPLVIYQSQVKLGLLQSDHTQLRAAVALQKLYYRVKDYTPPEATQLEIKRLVSRLESQQREAHPHSWAAKRRLSKSQKLVKILTDEEELAQFPSPHGLLINGDVGTGKSMLMDMFAQSLPKQSKQRWHYQNFILWCYNEIHTIHEYRKRRGDDYRDEFILFEIAQKMVRKNTVLLLDEFMLPDLTAAKIIKLLFTYFFKLGGVLVATSNRLPEDLYATDFRKAEFRSFLRVLESRCYSLDMNSTKDYRSLMCQEDTSSNIVISGGQNNKHDLFKLANVDPSAGTKSHIQVYGRQVEVSWSHNGTAMFDFNDICAGLYGPGDYISLASNYHTFIISNVPILKLNMRNEARRFITLLDALYECKCQVYLELETQPENLFFPETKAQTPAEYAAELELNRIKVQEEEMFSKTSIALNAPYRPNVSYYDDEKIQYKEDVPSFQSFDLSETSVNYASQKAFTGEDEKFAYKRAVSRLKEMNSNKYKDVEWQPLQHMMRPWESMDTVKVDHQVREAKHFINTTSGPAPTFDSPHFWSMGLWGKGERLNEMARRWIKGTTWA